MATQLQVQGPVKGATPDGSERRRSTRVLLVIPVDVCWTSKDGLMVQEHAETEVVSLHGAMLRMGSRLPAGTHVELRRPTNGMAAKAKVVGVGNTSQDGLARIAVELVVPSDAFWGVTFPPLVGQPIAERLASVASGKPPVTPAKAPVAPATTKPAPPRPAPAGAGPAKAPVAGATKPAPPRR